MKFYDAIIYHKRFNKEYEFKFEGFYCKTRDLNIKEKNIAASYDQKDYLYHSENLESDIKKIILDDKNIKILDSDIIEIQFFPKILGFHFNPLVIYRVFDCEEKFKCALLEVKNTFGGKHYYVLTSKDSYLDKTFHVSPFNKVEGQYHIILNDNFCQIDLIKENKIVFSASIEGKENINLNKNIIIKYPLYGFKILYEIHKHAAFLLLKNNKFYGTMNRKRGNIC